MPPDPPPPLSRTKRFHPISSKANTSNTRGDALEADIEMDAALGRVTPSRPEKRMTSMDVNQLWEQLLTDKQDNGDVIVPANLVPIMSALLLLMKETTLRMNAMEAQLRASSEATQRIDKLEKQFKAMMNPQVPNQTQSAGPPGLPSKPMSWTAAATKGLKITSHQIPQPPPANKVINAFRPSQVVIRITEGRQPFKDVKPTEIIRQVNSALIQLKVKVADRQLEVKGAAVLPSGAIKLFTSTRNEADWLLEHRTEWSTLADPELITTPVVFPVVIDSVPTDSYPATESIKQVLVEQNQ